VANIIVKSFGVAILDTRKTLIPCARMFIVVHFEDIYNYLVDYLYLSISVGVEGSGFGHFGFHLGPNVISLVTNLTSNVTSKKEL
jgi:hypothetical protein